MKGPSGSSISGGACSSSEYKPVTHLVRLQQHNYHSGSQPRNYLSYPSVSRLLRERGVSLDTADIRGTGPNGSLLKGDVLAYLGRVKHGYLSDQSQRLDDLSHLDLRHTKPVSVKPASENDALQANIAKSSSRPAESKRSLVEVTMPVSLDAIHRCQRAIRQSLDVNIPLSRFIKRASKIANEESSKQASLRMNKDIIFDAIIGHEREDRNPRFMPFISSSKMENDTTMGNREVDSLAFLTARWPAPTMESQPTRGRQETATSKVNIFSVKVAKENKSSASIFLNRIKALLEVEPGQLII